MTQELTAQKTIQPRGNGYAPAKEDQLLLNKNKNKRKRRRKNNRKRGKEDRKRTRTRRWGRRCWT